MRIRLLKAVSVLLVPALLVSACSASDPIVGDIHIDGDAYVNSLFTDNSSVYIGDNVTLSASDAGLLLVNGQPIISSNVTLPIAIGDVSGLQGQIDSKGTSNVTLPIGIADVTNLQIAIDGKEPSIASSNTSVFWRGDKTWAEVSQSSSWGDINGTLSNQSDLQSALDAKQATLVSGTNIKTVNGSTLLGAGDLTVGGSLPDQAGQAGKYLSTNGTDASWGAVHTHANQSTLDAIQEAFTTALKTSYDWLVSNITSAWKTSVDNHLTSTSNPHSTTAAQVGAPSGSGTSTGTNTGDQIVPANEAGAANNFLTAYNSGTGAFSKARPTWANVDKATSSIADITTRSHTSLADIGTNTHAQIDTFIASKGAANGLASLNGSTLVPTAQLGTGSASASTYLRGDQTWGTPGGSSPPAWHGKIVGAYGNGDPAALMMAVQRDGNIAPTPTNISASIARASFFRLESAITVNKVRFYGVGATTGIYRVAVYSYNVGSGTGTQIFEVNEINTSANAWGSAGSGLNVTLNAGTLYFIAVAVDTTGTTAGIAAWGDTLAATTGAIQVAPQSLPGNLDADAGFINGYTFQFAVTTGDLPATTGVLQAQAATQVGGMPAFWLDNSNA